MADDVILPQPAQTTSSNYYAYNPFLGWLGSLMGGAAGGLMGGGYTNPASSAMPYLEQVPGTITPYYQPYIDTGLNAMNQYYNNASSWATPEGASADYNAIAAGYTASPYTQYQDQQMQEAAAQSAAASGTAGTPSQQVAVSNEINAINSKAEQDYINTILGVQMHGQQGLGDLTHLGYNASDTLAQALMKNLGMESALSYAGTANQNKYNAQQSNMWSSLLGTAGSMLALF